MRSDFRIQLLNGFDDDFKVLNKILGIINILAPDYFNYIIIKFSGICALFV